MDAGGKQQKWEATINPLIGIQRRLCLFHRE